MIRELKWNFSNLKKLQERKDLIFQKKEKIKQDREARKQRWKEYKKQVWEETNILDLSILENFEKRGKGFQLDHKNSIYRGFLNNTPTKEISKIENLHFIHEKENLKKGIRSWDEYILLCK